MKKSRVTVYLHSVALLIVLKVFPKFTLSIRSFIATAIHLNNATNKLQTPSQHSSFTMVYPLRTILVDGNSSYTQFVKNQQKQAGKNSRIMSTQRQQDELEVVRSMFGDNVLRNIGSVDDSSTSFEIRFGDSGSGSLEPLDDETPPKLALQFTLPKEYPEEKKLEVKTKSADKYLDKVLREFIASELVLDLEGICLVIDCVTQLSISSGREEPEETSTKGTTATTASATNAQQTGNSAEQISLLDSEDFVQGLLEAGFTKVTEELFTHSVGRGVTIEKDYSEDNTVGKIYISCDGLDSEEVENFLTLCLKKAEAAQAAAISQEEENTGGKPVEQDGTSFLGKIPLLLLRWARAETGGEENPGFYGEEDEDSEGEESEEEDSSVVVQTKYLPLKQMTWSKDREITIQSWGRAMMKAPPARSEKNYNAGVLNGKKKGVNLKALNGLSDDLQRVISRCSLFPDWIRMVVESIERDDLHCVSINCTKGRHRSVAAAEILKKVFYGKAKVEHLTIH